MSYKTPGAFEKKEGEKDTINVDELANTLAEGLASGAPDIDDLSAWESKSGKMKIFLTEAFPTVAMDLTIPESTPPKT